MNKFLIKVTIVNIHINQYHNIVEITITAGIKQSCVYF